MHVYFSGIGAGIGPLALIAHRAGQTVSGSDKQDNSYVHYLESKGITGLHIGQSYQQIAEVHKHRPIDWFVYSSAIAKEQADPQELRFCREHHIKATRRNEFLAGLLDEHHLKMIAIAGTHGKTTTTAMMIWLFKQLGWPESHSVAAKASFAEMGEFDPESEYFIYEADEYDQNFLTFHPYLSIITGIDWDHPDIFPTREDYVVAFRQFLTQCREAVVWDADMDRLGLKPSHKYHQIREADPDINKRLHLAGLVNRQDAWAVAHAVRRLTDRPLDELLDLLDRFPGVERRFEKITQGVYSDYAHTPPKIRGALQLAREMAGNKVVVVYEGLHNTRQHFIKDELKNLFDDVKQLYLVPSYLAREDNSLPILNPSDLIELLSPEAQKRARPAALNAELAEAIQRHAAAGDTVICLTAGGGGSLDEWLRREFTPHQDSPIQDSPK